MAVKIEKGGWIMIFLVGLVLVGYSLVRYGVIDGSKLGVSGKSSSSGEKLDTSKPLALPVSSTTDDNAEVRIRVNVPSKSSTTGPKALPLWPPITLT